MNVPILKGDILMTSQEKLIQFIHNLTNEEADLLIAYLKESASSEEVSLLHPQNTAVQEQKVVA